MKQYSKGDVVKVDGREVEVVTHNEGSNVVQVRTVGGKEFTETFVNVAEIKPITKRAAKKAEPAPDPTPDPDPDPAADPAGDA